MRTITVLFAAFALVLGSTYAIAADESPSANTGDMEKLIGTWKGYEGRQRNLEATYTFWIEQNRLFGKSQYLHLVKQRYMKGVLSKIRVSGNTVQFVVQYSGADVAEARAVYKLELKGSTLKGRGRKLHATRGIGEFGVSLKKVE